MNKIAAMAGIASILFISACGGNANNSGSAKATTETGEMIYRRTCVACHQPNGEGLGTSFPPLAHSDYITDVDKTILQVIKGSSGELVVNGKTYNNTMPPQQLSDEEVAKVLTYVYESFGNTGKKLAENDVKAVRGKM